MAKKTDLLYQTQASQEILQYITVSNMCYITSQLVV